MSKLSTLTSRGRFLGAAAALLLTTAVSALAPTLAGAEQVTTRSLQLSSSESGDVTGFGANTGVAGTSGNGSEVSYTFTFDAPTAGSIQSFSTMFCTTAFGYLNSTGLAPLPLSGVPGSGDSAPCAVPGLMNATNAPNPTVTIGGVASTATWTTAAGSPANVIRVSASAAEPITAGQTVVFEFKATESKSIKNPTLTHPYTANPAENTFFANLATYSDNGYATRVDEGTVTSAITDSVSITARVQETLKFSVGTDVTTTPVTSACESVAGPFTLTMGDINGALSADTSYDAKSYFRVSTNASAGTQVQYAGPTLTSGSNTISPITTNYANAVGTEQFGLGIDTSDSTLSALVPETNYGSAAGLISTATPAFAFDPLSVTNPEAIASSSTNIVCETGSVRYVGNIDSNTEAGIYRTSINYIAVPKY